MLCRVYDIAPLPCPKFCLSNDQLITISAGVWNTCKSRSDGLILGTKSS